MKVILSHDVDHITVWEHYKDLIIPKHILRNHIELFKGKISFKENILRFNKLFSNKWQNIQEIMDYHDSKGIKSVFFLGVNNGLGLSYKLKHVEKWAPIIQARGFEAGVHGISYENLDAIQKEFKSFSKIIHSNEIGIRMHYLRQNTNTFENLANAGYLYDCSKFEMKNPYKIGNMWEFPLQIMEGFVFQQDKKYQVFNLKQAIEETKKIITQAQDKNLKYLSLLFHDRYFDNAFFDWKKWYIAIVDYFLEQKFEIITYKRAIKELNSNPEKLL